MKNVIRLNLLGFTAILLFNRERHSVYSYERGSRSSPVSKRQRYYNNNNNRTRLLKAHFLPASSWFQFPLRRQRWWIRDENLSTPKLCSLCNSLEQGDYLNKSVRQRGSVLFSSFSSHLSLLLPSSSSVARFLHCRGGIYFKLCSKDVLLGFVLENDVYLVSI